MKHFRLSNGYIKVYRLRLSILESHQAIQPSAKLADLGKWPWQTPQ